MTDAPWFKFHLDHERVVMDTLTDEQYAAHTRLRVYAWTAGGLPEDPTSVRAIGRWPATAWRRIWPAVSRLWVARDGQLVNEALEVQRADVQMRSDSGRSASAKRWQSKRTADALPTQCHREVEEERDKEEEVRERELTLSLVTARPGVYDLSPGQIKASASGLYAAWNNIACASGHLKPFEADPPFSASVHRALTARSSIDWWASTFSLVGASDYLRGLIPGRDGTPFVATFWWVLEHAEKIAAGQYINRERISRNGAALAEVLKDFA